MVEQSTQIRKCTVFEFLDEFSKDTERLKILYMEDYDFKALTDRIKLMPDKWEEMRLLKRIAPGIHMLSLLAMASEEDLEDAGHLLCEADEEMIEWTNQAIFHLQPIFA